MFFFFAGSNGGTNSSASFRPLENLLYRTWIANRLSQQGFSLTKGTDGRKVNFGIDIKEWSFFKKFNTGNTVEILDRIHVLTRLHYLSVSASHFSSRIFFVTVIVIPFLSDPFLMSTECGKNALQQLHLFSLAVIVWQSISSRWNRFSPIL